MFKFDKLTAFLVARNSSQSKVYFAAKITVR